jgi:serine/threonine-protein kinase
MSLAKGARIGKYVVERELGHGGFGVIYVARDTGLDRDVALKVLRPEHVSRRDLVQRFLQEARAAAKIDHPGIVTVFECGVVDHTASPFGDADGRGRAAPVGDSRNPADGTVYIAMELLRGETLARRVKRGRLPIAMALGLCQQSAAALGAAHRAGIVHRDLKPDNLFLCPDRAVLGGERVKLLDFGIAKLAEPGWSSEVKTHSMTLLGTPMYMSPEQCKSSAKVDARSDIYTLGCIVYELVCGRPPYDGDSGELIAKHQLAPVPQPRLLAPELPPSLDALLRAMLAKQPEDRPQNMEQVEAQLEMCLAHGDDAPTGMMNARAPTAQPIAPPAAPPPPVLTQATAGTIDVPTAHTTLSSSARGGVLDVVRGRPGIVFGALGATLFGVVIAVISTCHGTVDVPAPLAAARPEAVAIDAAVTVTMPAPAPPPAPVLPVDAAAVVVVPVVAPADAAADPRPRDVDDDFPMGPAETDMPPDRVRPRATRKAKTAPAQPAPAPATDETNMFLPAPANCDAEAHKRRGEAANASGAHAQALLEFEVSLRCKRDPHVISLAYMEACDMGNDAKAKQYFALMPATGSYSQATLLQMCMRHQIDPRPNAP